MKASSNSTPRHVAIIMDGNRRWAKQHKLQALQGHEYVADEMIERLVDHAAARGVEYLTLWAFSTENWNRDSEEVTGLMSIFRKSFSRSAQQLHEKNVRLGFIGDINRFPDDIQAGVKHWLDISQSNTRITVTFALNYGGRDELVRAVAKIASQHSEQPISQETISTQLDTAGMPDPDLIIRPGGEMRLSGFLPWQSVYSELYFTEVLMPDFDEKEFDKAIDEYAKRQRRFGK